MLVVLVIMLLMYNIDVDENVDAIDEVGDVSDMLLMMIVSIGDHVDVDGGVGIGSDVSCTHPKTLVSVGLVGVGIAVCDDGVVVVVFVGTSWAGHKPHFHSFGGFSTILNYYDS